MIKWLRDHPIWFGAIVAVLLYLISLIFASFVAMAEGQSNCTDRGAALSHLSKAYQEQPVGMGLASSGGVVELTVSRDGGSWTIIVTLPSGVTCLVAAGEDWEIVAPKIGIKH